MKTLMKTLIINGSPRKKGDTVALIEEMVKYLNGEVKIINTYYDKISPCIDCRHCWTHSDCVIKDDMQEVYNLMNEVDNVIIASPLYFSELTGSLLSFFSRFQLYYSTRKIRKDENFKLKKKNGVLILVGGGDTTDLNKALHTANILFRLTSTNQIGNIFSLNTDVYNGRAGTRAKDDAEALKTAQELACKLNELYEMDDAD